MGASRKRSFSLPAEQSAFIDEKVNSGQFASGSDVIQAGLRALQERDDAVERWLAKEVAATYDAARQGRGLTVPVADAFDQIRARHARATKPEG